MAEAHTHCPRTRRRFIHSTDLSELLTMSASKRWRDRAATFVWRMATSPFSIGVYIAIAIWISFLVNAENRYSGLSADGCPVSARNICRPSKKGRAVQRAAIWPASTFAELSHSGSRQAAPVAAPGVFIVRDVPTLACSRSASILPSFLDVEGEKHGKWSEEERSRQRPDIY